MLHFYNLVKNLTLSPSNQLNASVYGIISKKQRLSVSVRHLREGIVSQIDNIYNCTIN